MLIAKNDGRFTEAALDDELLLMHVDTGEFHGLSGIGLEIWRMLDSEKDPAVIAAKLVERYDVDPATCVSEVDAFVRELEQARFIVAG